MLSRRLFICGMTASLCFGSAQITATEAQTLVFSTPEDLRVGALMAQKILLQAYLKMGVEINFLPIPAARSSVMWEDGRLDGVAYRLANTELANGLKLSTPVAYGDVVAYSINKQFTIEGYQGLKPYRIGYIAGAPFVLEKLKDIPRIESAPNIDSLFKKLQMGRSDLVIESSFSLCFVHKMGMSNVIMLQPPLETALGYHYLHRRHQHLYAQLEKTLLSMKLDGSLKKLQEQAIQEFSIQCPL
jgi:polar amino acid transport system substrate-binding protein